MPRAEGISALIYHQMKLYFAAADDLIMSISMIEHIPAKFILHLLLFALTRCSFRECHRSYSRRYASSAARYSPSSALPYRDTAIYRMTDMRNTAATRSSPHTIEGRDASRDIDSRSPHRHLTLFNRWARLLET